MGTRLYVGNLSYSTTKESLREAFEVGGRKVENVFVVTDRETGRSRGFAFVEMSTQADAEAAVAAMDGALVDGRALRVNEARERGAPGGPGGGPGGPPPRREFSPMGPRPDSGPPPGRGFGDAREGGSSPPAFGEGPSSAPRDDGPGRNVTRPAKAPWKPRDDYRPSRERDERAGRGRSGGGRRERSDDWTRTDWTSKADDDDDDLKKKTVGGAAAKKADGEEEPKT
ncbi:MAG: hypothetical protein HY908_14275 [Myxococcales bacterium]|nr:hypothetical protein [Myxococcales bacterium]